jgi:hypothetical protein
MINDILRNAILKLSDTRRTSLIDRAANIEYNRAGFLAKIGEYEEGVGEMESELRSIEKELHRLTIIDNELEEI